MAVSETLREEALRLFEERSKHTGIELDRWRDWIDENYSYLGEKEVWILRDMIVLGSYPAEGFAHLWAEEMLGVDSRKEDLCELKAEMIDRCDHLVSLGLITLIEDASAPVGEWKSYSIAVALRTEVKRLFPLTDYPHLDRLWDLVNFARKRYSELDPMNDGEPCDGKHKMVLLVDIIRIGLEGATGPIKA